MDHFPIVDIELELQIRHPALSMLVRKIASIIGRNNLGRGGEGRGHEKDSISYSLVVLL